MSMLRIAGAAIATVVLVGCGSATTTTTETPPAATQGAPTASVGPTQAPDVSGPFKTAFAAMKTGILTLSGTITLGQVQITLTGTNTVNGPDSSDSTTTTVGGVVTTTKHVQVAGERYVKTGNGPWLTDTSAAPTSDLSKELNRLAALVIDVGPEQRNGVTVHRLTPPTGSGFDLGAFGLGGGAATNVMSKVAFFALEDGTPSEVTIDLGWTQPGGTGTVDGALSIDIALSQLGVPHLVQAPDHVWPVLTSTVNAFSMAYPDDFGTSADKGVDYFDGPASQLVGVGRNVVPGGATLNGLTSGEVASIKTGYNTGTVKNDDYTLGGLRARFLTATGTLNKQEVAIYEVLVLKANYIYAVFWVGPAASAADDLVTFKEMLATFAFK